MLIPECDVGATDCREEYCSTIKHKKAHRIVWKISYICARFPSPSCSFQIVPIEWISSIRHIANAWIPSTLLSRRQWIRKRNLYLVSGFSSSLFLRRPAAWEESFQIWIAVYDGDVRAFLLRQWKLVIDSQDCSSFSLIGDYFTGHLLMTAHWCYVVVQYERNIREWTTSVYGESALQRNGCISTGHPADAMSPK